MKVLSLFDGISIARVALERAGIPVTEYYASEIDPAAIRIAQRNFPDTIQLGDVRSVTKKSVGGGRTDLLIGGSPCQDLSRAKTDGKGLAGSRSSLFYEYVRILKEVRPRYFILENVASMKQIYRDEITRTLGVKPIMIDAGLVSAQIRKRYFWTNIPGVCIPHDRGIVLADIIEEHLPMTPLKLTIHGRIQGWKENEQKIYAFNRGAKSAHISERTYHKPGAKCGTLTTSKPPRIYVPDGYIDLIKVLPDGTLKVREATKKGYAIAHEGDSIDVSFPNSSTRRGRVGKKAKTLMTSAHICVYTHGKVRPLSPLECERLQCLPDGYTEGESDSQRVFACGNGFNAEVIAHILKHAASGPETG